MENLQKLETSVLVDLLESKLREYYYLSKQADNSDSSITCLLAIKAIQDEVDTRKRKNSFYPGKSRQELQKDTE